ncbi:MAG: hypothetical protein EOO39_32930 [Cytophagaceae bacterium]|nr:MAG: hypothetical protein EOO39_32930 [Cytophagaceae bacterium]
MRKTSRNRYVLVEAIRLGFDMLKSFPLRPANTIAHFQMQAAAALVIGVMWSALWFPMGFITYGIAGLALIGSLAMRSVGTAWGIRNGSIHLPRLSVDKDRKLDIDYHHVSEELAKSLGVLLVLVLAVVLLRHIHVLHGKWMLPMLIGSSLYGLSLCYWWREMWQMRTRYKKEQGDSL